MEVLRSTWWIRRKRLSLTLYIVRRYFFSSHRATTQHPRKKDKQLEGHERGELESRIDRRGDSRVLLCTLRL